MTKLAPYSLKMCYFLWLLGFCGLCGLHRFYLRRYGSGVLWVVTLGGLGVLQLIDLVLMPFIVDQTNVFVELENLAHYEPQVIY